MKMRMDEIAQILYESAQDNSLGFFVGSGFTKAVLADNYDNRALTWLELLEAVVKSLGFDIDVMNLADKSMPEKASTICRYIADHSDYSYQEATLLFKKKVCQLTNWYPTKNSKKMYNAFFETLDVSWFITTNYDMILESILVGKGITLNPKDVLISKAHKVPIFHLHGTRYKPESIIITQEDYITLFRPNEYRQRKLSLLFKESTTVLIGYGLGDINVLTALDWMNNVYQHDGYIDYHNEVIQVLYVQENPSEPYRNDANMIIIETSNIEDTLNDLTSLIDVLVTENQERQDEIIALNQELLNATDDYLENFIEDDVFRIKKMKELICLDEIYEDTLISFYEKVFKMAQEKTYIDNNFGAYDHKLKIILDYFIEIDMENMSPSIIQLFTESLNQLSKHLGYEVGRSWCAFETWNKRKVDLPDDIKEEILSWCACYRFDSQLVELIESP